jgi:cell division protein FtsN
MDFTSLLDKSPGAIAVLVLVLGLLLTGRIVTREAAESREEKVRQQLEQVRKERDEWKDLYFAALQTGQRGVNAAERRLRPH